MKNIKSKIIPDYMKKNIDEILENQLFNANRYYAESNCNISELMNIEVKKLPTQFLHELRSRWNWHNHFYEDLLEPSYLEITKESFNNLSPTQISDLIEIYKTCCLVDEATLVTSGAIKKHLEYQLPYISIVSEDVSAEDANFMLLTPPIETFFAQYQIDHLSYIALLQTDVLKAEKFKQYLLNQYHAGDEVIFKGRLEKDFSDKMTCSLEELYRDINDFKISDGYKVKHLYFTLEHPQRKAFRDLIIYDNVDEKFISSQLVGISGFLFRKKILEYLNESGKLPNNGYIYEFSNDCVISSLTELLEERRHIMEKDVRPYRQTGMTCAISCMLMVLEYYKIIPKADWSLEKKYYRSYQSRYMDGTPFSALAWHFSKNGLDTEIIHSEKNMFTNSSNLLSNDVFNNAMDEYSSFLEIAKEKGTKVTNGLDVTGNLIREKLEDGKMVILAGSRYGFLHAILVCGYHNDDFVVCDPLYKQKQTKSLQELEDYMNTPLGKWCVVVSEKVNNKNKLMEEIPNYKKDAEKMLNVVLDEKQNKIYQGQMKIKK